LKIPVLKDNKIYKQIIYLFKMTSLKELGVTRIYEQNIPDRIKYSISVPSELKSPKHAEKYFKRVINAVSRDAAKEGRLDKLSISLDTGRYLGAFQSVAENLVARAEQQKSIRENSMETNLGKFLLTGGAIAGGLVGFAWGYDQMSGLATDAADYMNNASYLLAPITGLAQAGISLVGTALTTLGGIVIVNIIGGIITEGYVYATTSLAKKASGYRSLEKALSDASPLAASPLEASPLPETGVKESS